MVDFNKKLKDKEGAATHVAALEAPAEGTEKGLTIATPGGAVANVSDEDAGLLSADAGSGLEKVTKDDLAIPRLALLQALSEQCKKTSTEYIPEARPGDFFDNVMGKLYDGEKGIDLVFVSFRPTILQWWLRNNKAGSGFIADLGPDMKVLEKCTRGPKGEYIPPDNADSELVPTKEYFAYLVDKSAGTWWPIMVSMSKSQRKYAEKLNTLLTQRQIEIPDPKNAGKTIKITPPMFFHMWHCTTVPEKNKNGDEWMSWDIQPGVDLMPSIRPKDSPIVELPAFGRALYLSARGYKEKADSGKVNVAPPAGGEGAATSDANEEPEKVPF